SVTNRRCINKKLEKSSASTISRVLTSKDKDPFSFTSTSTAKSQLPDGLSFPSFFHICGFCCGSLILIALFLSGTEGDDTSWISWFCNLRGNDFFCEVDEDYIQDDFNLCGLSGQVPYYDNALNPVLDAESSNSEMFTKEQNERVESGLIHVCYILTTKKNGCNDNSINWRNWFREESTQLVQAWMDSLDQDWLQSVLNRPEPKLTLIYNPRKKKTTTAMGWPLSSRWKLVLPVWKNLT
ncbi:PREDICTED: casein kinase II subunit beta-3-like, partial [Camelina sativa]|uniref:Casein kinase II subunit beta n=1 Tax=Camelina sativa TaxID=90675 RepID=A0ABM1RAX1_CAMSA